MVFGLYFHISSLNGVSGIASIARGSKYAYVKDISPKYYTYGGLWGLVPSYLSTRTSVGPCSQHLKSGAI